MKNSDLHDNRASMIETLQSIWKHAEPIEREFIKNIWLSIMQPARVVMWRSIENHGPFQLKINEPIVGRHADIPMGEVIIEKEMKIAFSEENISGKGRYRQMMRFPEKGISIRIGMGWLSKESPIQSIAFEQKEDGHMWCTVEMFGQLIARSADDALAFWKKVDWQI